MWSNRQKNQQEQATAFSSRQSEIKDRSLNACVDVLKTGRLVSNAANALALLTTPPLVMSTYVDYLNALSLITDEVYNYKVDSGAPLTGPDYRTTPITE